MDALTCLLISLVNGAAAAAALDAWFRGSLFAGWRALAQDWRDNGNWRATRLAGGAISCRFCLGYHVTLWLSILTVPILPSAWLVPAVWLCSRFAAGQLSAGTEDDDDTDDDDTDAGGNAYVDRGFAS